MKIPSDFKLVNLLGSCREITEISTLETIDLWLGYPIFGKTIEQKCKSNGKYGLPTKQTSFESKSNERFRVWRQTYRPSNMEKTAPSWTFTIIIVKIMFFSNFSWKIETKSFSCSIMYIDHGGAYWKVHHICIQ